MEQPRACLRLISRVRKRAVGLKNILHKEEKSRKGEKKENVVAVFIP